MANLQFTYIFPPHFSYRPEDLPLGSLLRIDQKTGLPDLDPDTWISDAADVIPVPSDEVRTDTERTTDKPWSYTGVIKAARSGGLTFELPVISPLVLGGKSSREKSFDIHIECASVRTSYFRPSRQYIAQVLNDDMVKAYAKGTWRPSLFMVTGVKIADHVKLCVGREIAQHDSGKFELDFSGIGAPININTNGGASSNARDKIQTELNGPLVLAYQVKHIRIKARGEFVAKDHTSTAVLFSEVPADDVASASEDLSKAWHIEDLIAGNL